MRLSGRLLYLVSLAAMAVVTALAMARVARPSIAWTLVWAALVATAAGAPGLVRRRAWPLALPLLVAGAYLVARVQAPLPSGDHGFAGLGFYFGQIHAGAHAYTQRTFPLSLAGAAGLKLLLTLVVYAAAGFASLLALGLRRALAAIVVFLVLFGFSLTVDGTGSVVLLPLTFLLLSGCLLALSRSLERARGTAEGVVAGAATAVLATVLALFLLVATPVAASKPWQDWSKWGPLTQDTSRLTFDFMLNFPSLLNPKTNAKVFTVQSPSPSYWRANALDYFSGSAWLAGAPPGAPLAPESRADPDIYDVPPGATATTGTPNLEVFRLAALSTPFLLSGGVPLVVNVSGHPPVYSTVSQALRTTRPLQPQASYSLTANVAHLTPIDLVARGRDYPADLAADLALPFETGVSLTRQQWLDTLNDSRGAQEWRGLYALNRQIVGRATDPYQIALRIEQYLRLHYAYSLQPPASRFTSPYAAFLFDTRIGYCQHFAGAMAVLLRFNGIPARVAVGFATGGLVGRDSYIVTRNDAHAWVEVYFPRVGWVSFEPTPGDTLPGLGPSSTNAGFADPYPSDGGATSVAASGAAPPKLQGLPSGASAKQKGTGVGTATAVSHTPDWPPWVVALATVLLVWPFARAALRRRGLHHGSPDDRLRAALALVAADLRDYGLPVPRSQTLVETSRLLKERLDYDATPVTDRAEAVLFGGRPADKRDLADLARLRAELRRRLRARAGWTGAVRARYGLRTALR
jgi:protein-glutamine gamma-glutamyltransferase